MDGNAVQFYGTAERQLARDGNAVLHLGSRRSAFVGARHARDAPVPHPCEKHRGRQAVTSQAAISARGGALTMIATKYLRGAQLQAVLHCAMLAAAIGRVRS